MRRYQIFIDDQPKWQSSFSALNIEIDIPVSDLGTPRGNALLRVYGVPLDEIKTSKQYEGKYVSIYGGMGKGMPLANPAQYGLLATGKVHQCFGNWSGTDQYIEFNIVPDDRAKNITLEWPAGSSLGDALKSALSAAYPTANITNLTDDVKLDYDNHGYYSSVEALATIAKKYNPKLVIIKNGGDITITDKPKDASKTISINDFVGQPTWIDANTIGFTCVMRGDIDLTTTIDMTMAITGNTQQGAYGIQKNMLTETGKFQVTFVRHLGNYRNTDAGAWSTTIEAVTL